MEKYVSQPNNISKTRQERTIRLIPIWPQITDINACGSFPGRNHGTNSKCYQPFFVFELAHSCGATCQRHSDYVVPINLELKLHYLATKTEMAGYRSIGCIQNQEERCGNTAGAHLPAPSRTSKYATYKYGSTVTVGFVTAMFSFC